MEPQPADLSFGTFLAPYHPVKEHPTLALERDFELVRLLDQLGYDEAWIGEHHSGGYEVISSPELFIATAAERTRHIRFGTGVNSLCFHHPLILADRIVQLDHQTRGRIMFGAGPGQLPTDAFMVGLSPLDQRRMMGESLECLVELFEGRTVTRQTDWFHLREARLQLLPFQRPRFEMSVACAVTPTGPVTAGRLGLGMLSLAASTPIGFSALGEHWGVHEQAAVDAGVEVDRRRWRVVVSMHLAESRGQALENLESGVLDLVHYIRSLRGNFSEEQGLDRDLTAAQAVELWSTSGLGTFGVVMAGTPDDAIWHIEKLLEQSGGFGTILFLEHNCASFAATCRSYELFARYVVPHFQGRNRNRRASLAWMHENSREIYGSIVAATRQAIAEHDGSRKGGGDG